MISLSSSPRLVGRLVVLCVCASAVLSGCDSTPPAFDAKSETEKIDQAIAKVKSDPKLTEAQKTRAVATLEGAKPTEPKIAPPAMK